MEVGGAQRLLIERLTSQESSHHETILINTLPRENYLEPEFRRSGINFLNTSSNSVLKSALEVFALIRKLKPDALILHSPAPASLLKALRLIRAIRVPLIEVIHSSRYANLTTQFASICTNRGADLTLPVARFILKTPLVLFCRKVIALHHGISTSKIKLWKENQKTELHAIRKELEFGHIEPLTVVFVGRLVWQKNPLRLPVILEQVKHLNVVINLVGDGILMDDMVAAVSAKGLENRFQILGQKDDAWKYIAAADVLIMPSKFEGLGLVIMEAMAGGTPVLASPFGAVDEILADGETGLITIPDTDEQYASYLEMLANNPSKLKQMKSACSVQSDYWDREARSSDFYKQIAGVVRKGPR